MKRNTANSKPDSDALPPVVARLKGIAEGADIEDYHRYLEERYGRPRPDGAAKPA